MKRQDVGRRQYQKCSHLLEIDLCTCTSAEEIRRSGCNGQYPAESCKKMHKKLVSGFSFVQNNDILL